MLVLLLTLNGVILLFIAILGWLWLRQRHTVNSDSLALMAQFKTLKSEFAAICACQAEVGEQGHLRDRRLQELSDRLELLTKQLENQEGRLRQLSRRQNDLIHTPEPGETSYGAAIRLAHQGADVDQLVNTFGIARGEAELIAAMHRAQKDQAILQR